MVDNGRIPVLAHDVTVIRHRRLRFRLGTPRFSVAITGMHLWTTGVAQTVAALVNLSLWHGLTRCGTSRRLTRWVCARIGCAVQSIHFLHVDLVKSGPSGMSMA